MSNQRDPNRLACMCYIPRNIAASIKTIIKGKTVKIKPKEGKKVIKQTRDMCMSDYLIGLAEKSVRNIKPSPDALAWADAKYQKNLCVRKKQDLLVHQQKKAKTTQKIKVSAKKSKTRKNKKSYN